MDFIREKEKWFWSIIKRILKSGEDFTIHCETHERAEEIIKYIKQEIKDEYIS